MTIVFAMLISIALSAIPAKACTLQWNPNGEADLAGYKIYESKTPGSYGAPRATLGPVTTIDCGPESDGLTHYFSITAYDSAGNESPFSNEVSKLFAQATPPPPPPPPTGSVTADRTTTSVTVPANAATWIETAKVTNGTGAPVTVTWADVMPQLIDVRPSNQQTIPAGGTAKWEHLFQSSPSGTYRGIGTLTGGGLDASIQITVTSGAVAPPPPPPPPVDPPPAPPTGLKIVSATPDKIVVEALKSDCPLGVSTSTTGSTTSKLRRTITCKR